MIIIYFTIKRKIFNVIQPIILPKYRQLSKYGLYVSKGANMNNLSIHEIAWQASQKLCGNVNFLEALTDLFHYLKQYIPIEYLFIGKLDEKNSAVNVFAYISSSKSAYYNFIYHYSKEQKKIIKENNFFDIDETCIHYIPNEKHKLAPVYMISGNTEFKNISLFPLAAYRIAKNKKLYGGPTFTFKKGTIITEEMKQLFELLKAPFTIFINAFFQHEELKELHKTNTKIEPHSLSSDHAVIGFDNGLKKITEQVNTIAPLDISVMVRGETGTGKEVVAHAIHNLSYCKDGPFISINCGAIVPELINSEFFGHVKGSFTGAVSNHTGYFEQANGGTLFLDEVAELPLSTQVNLLRVLQEHTIQKVGGTEIIPVNFRLIVATHRPLEEMVALGTFREDLYYRLNVINIKIPPLRERKEDIPALLNHFLKRYAERFKKDIPEVSPSELNKLIQYDWPGNIRQFQNVVAEAVALSKNNGISFSLPFNEELGERSKQETNNCILSTKSLPDFNTMVKTYLEQALIQCNGKITGRGSVAELTKLPNSTLKGKLDKYNIPYKRNG